MSLSDDIHMVKRFLRDRLQNDWTTFRGHLNEWKTIHDLLKRTAENSESNSALLIGPRGCGKTTLVSSVLYSLLSVEVFHKNVLIVYLNGLMHTDDRIALKSATAQLNLENAVDGKVFGSFAENLTFLLACLRSGNKKSKSIIFILEEFDLFCTHHNQTLLYNLFDVSQSAQAPICVLGITCRLDVIELLEKRVKSRFSHRQIFLFPENKFEGRMELFKSLLKLPSEKNLEDKNSERPNLECIENSEIFFFRSFFDATNYEFPENLVNSWNAHIDDLCNDSNVEQCLKNLFDYDVTEAFFKTFLFKLISKINDKHSHIKADDVSQIAAAYNLDDKVQLLCGLSVLELCLVIAIKHHSEIYDRDPFNFEIIFTRFMKFAKTSPTMQGVERSVVLKAFEHLKNLEFIVPLSWTTSKVQKEFQMHKLLLTNGQINQAVNKYHPKVPVEVSHWALSSLF